MSRYSTPRGTARAIRRGNTAPSIKYIVLDDEPDEAEAAYAEFEMQDRERRALYRDMREEGYSREQALLSSGLADPDSLAGFRFIEV